MSGKLEVRIDVKAIDDEIYVTVDGKPLYRLVTQFVKLETGLPDAKVASADVSFMGVQVDT